MIYQRFYWMRIKVASQTLIAMFKPLISKYARQLPCDCAETDLIIAMLEFIRDLDAERIKSCNDAVLVSYITPMLRNKK